MTKLSDEKELASKFCEEVLGMSLYEYQRMILDETFDFSDRSAWIMSRNYLKSLQRNIWALRQILEGKEAVIVCASEERAKQVFDELVEFFEGLKNE